MHGVQLMQPNNVCGFDVVN